MASNRAQILISAVDQTKTAFDSIKRGLGGLTDTAKSVNGVLANLGVAVSVAGLTAMVKSAIDTGDALDEMSQRVGVSVETLSVWKPAAEQSGVSGESFEKGLRKLSTTMLEAATGSEDAARGFSAVGVEFKNQDGTLRATDQVLLDLAERFKAMPDGAEKTALAVQLFGKSGAELIPFLNQGRDGINELAAEMQALGVQMSSETAAQAGNFNDALDKLKLATTSIGNQIIASLLPALNDMAGGMVESAKQGGTLRVILDGVVLVLKTLALGAATVGKAFVALGEAIGAGAPIQLHVLPGIPGRIGEARAAGYAQGTLPLVSFVDPDDLYGASAFTQLADALDACPQAVMAYTDEALTDENGHDIAVRRLAYSRWQHANSASHVHGLIVMRRAAVEAVLKETSDINNFADWLLTLLVAKRGGVLYLPVVGRHWRQHPQQSHRTGDPDAVRRIRQTSNLWR